MICSLHCIYPLFDQPTTAEYQSAMVARLRGGMESSSSTATTPSPCGDNCPPFRLTLTEERVMNRGRNAGTKTNHRKSNPAAYQDATALEALLGYLYITDRPRCTQLLQWMDYHMDNIKY